MKKNSTYYLKRRHRLFTLFFLLLTGFGSVAIAQTAVTGAVSDGRGEELLGVSVKIKGTDKATTTDANGRFRIEAPAQSTLVFSYLGFASKEVALAGRTSINVTLEATSKTLSDVVVTALGIKKEARRLGYSATTVKASEVTTNRTNNIGNSLQGKVAGVVVSPPTTGAGGSSKIRIRGVSSFGSNNTPLFIVNGVPIDNTNFGVQRNDASVSIRGSNFSDGGDALTSINPDDVESVTILKGGPAAALYGSRAKDGAILITTKSGKGTQGIGVEFNTNTVMDRVIDQTDFQYVYGQGENGVRPADLTAAQNTGTWSFGGKLDGTPQIQFDGQTKPYLPVKNRITDFYQNGYTTTNSVGFSKGSDAGSFRLGVSDMNNKSIMPNSNFRKQTIDFGSQYQLGKKLSVGVNATFSHEKNRNPPNVIVQNYNPAVTLYNLGNSISLEDLKNNRKDESGNERNISRFTTRTNPYWWAYDHAESIIRDRLFGNASLKYNILPWLSIQGRAGQDYYSRDHDNNVPTGTRTLPPAPPGAFGGEFYQESLRFRERNYDFLVNANRRFGDFGMEVNAGGNQMTTIYRNNNVLVNNFYIRDLYTVMNGFTKDPQYYYSEKRINSLYAAADFDYKNFLFLSVTGRNDWFSTLNPKTNNIFYPSVSTSFVFSELMQNASWLRYGKLRMAYAEVGGGTDPYGSNLYYGLNANPLGNVVLGSISGSITPNQFLRPLAVKEFEVGLESRLFSDKLFFDLTYYRKKSLDDILRVQTSITTGFQQALVNIGELQNHGLEFLLGGVPVKSSNFTWNVSVNGSYNKNKVNKLVGTTQKMVAGSAEFNGQIVHIVGQPMAVIEGNSYLRSPDGQIINANGVPAVGPLKTFGSTMAKVVGGVSNSLSFKAVKFSFLIDGRFGGKLLSQTNFNLYRIGLSKETLPGRENNSVIGPGVKADPANPGKFLPNDVGANPQTYYAAVRGNANIEPFIYKSDFVKLRQVTLGYDFTQYLARTKTIKGAVLSLVANNVAVLKKYVPNVDPEMMASTSDNLSGIEGNTMPLTRSLGLNLNVKF